MQTLPGFNIMYESSVVIPSTLLAQQSKVKRGGGVQQNYNLFPISEGECSTHAIEGNACKYLGTFSVRIYLEAYSCHINTFYLGYLCFVICVNLHFKLYIYNFSTLNLYILTTLLKKYTKYAN